MPEGLYNIYYARHGENFLQVGHDFYLRWFLEIDRDGKWTRIDNGHTRKSALDGAHNLFHHYQGSCDEKLQWELDRSTRAKVLGECPKCLNPNMEGDLKTYRRCPDCGWAGFVERPLIPS
jgi:hypothetical protein